MASSKKILVTGAAGFIGFHVARRLLQQGHAVVGVDCVNDYYDPALKVARCDALQKFPAFEFRKLNIADGPAMEALFTDNRFPCVINLAAQAGVRYSLTNPHAYIESNLTGFANLLEGCRHHGCENLIFASSSSVYGANTRLPFRASDPVDHPLSLYGATKRSNELMAHSYAHLFKLPTTGLRFFTVYGPWGRPDMAMWLFASAILDGRPIKLFNRGDMRRDFTFVDDVVESIVRLVDKPAAPDPNWSGNAPAAASSNAPWRLYNIGNNSPADLRYVVQLIEEAIGKKAQRELLPMQAGDVYETFADVEDLARDVGFRPSTSIESGVQQFIAWYRDYHGL